MQVISAVWVSNLCFQPIIYYSLALSCRMLINKWDRLLAHPEVSKNGCMINKWFKGKLFLIRWVGLGSQRLMHRIKMGSEIFQKMVSMYPTFSFTIVSIFQIYYPFKIHQSYTAWHQNLTITSFFVMKISHKISGKKQKVTLAIYK